MSSCCSALFLVKLQVFGANGSDEVCNGVRFYLHAVVVCFGKASGLFSLLFSFRKLFFPIVFRLSVLSFMSQIF